MHRIDCQAPKYGPPQRFPPGLELLLAAARERSRPEALVEEKQPLIQDGELHRLLLELHDG